MIFYCFVVLLTFCHGISKSVFFFSQFILRRIVIISYRHIQGGFGQIFFKQCFFFCDFLSLFPHKFQTVIDKLIFEILILDRSVDLHELLPMFFDVFELSYHGCMDPDQAIVGNEFVKGAVSVLERLFLGEDCWELIHKVNISV